MLLNQANRFIVPDVCCEQGHCSKFCTRSYIYIDTECLMLEYKTGLLKDVKLSKVNATVSWSPMFYKYMVKPRRHVHYPVCGLHTEYLVPFLLEDKHLSTY